MTPRLALAILLPFIACAAQWLLWDAFKPYVWFLFFPTAFFSAWIGGLVGGLAATVISALLVWFVFIPPAFSFALNNFASAISIVVFVFMGSLFAYFFERLQHSMRRTDEALAAAEAANGKITQLYQKTLELDTLKSQFFANVSHELRTPLTLILAPLERRLRQPASQDFPEAERRETEIMVRNARQLYRHVTDLLDAAKLEAGRMPVAWTRLDLVRLVRTVASQFESLATEHRIDYSVMVPESLPAEADGEKLQRVLLNLLSNAFKFTPDGGAIVLRLTERDNQALIEVQDNGPGVPAALREAVFERFHQGDANAPRRRGGTGLGLSIVKDFVELHGGAITLDEAAGGGALFSIRLPLAAPDGTVLGAPRQIDEIIDRQAIEELEMHTAPALPNNADIAPADAPLVLVVEDNTDMNEFIAATLRPTYRVASARDGREGLDQALRLQPDLIITDLMMPEMSGDQMVAALRRQSGMENVPIIMLTAKADDELRMRLLKEGVQEYLNKPFSTEELLARIGGLVAARRRTVEELSRSAQRLRRLAEVVEKIAAVHDLPSLMAIVRRAVRELTEADGATLVLRDNGQCHYVDEDAIGPLWKGQRFPLESCISGWTMLHAEATAIEDIYADARIPHAAYRPTFVKSLSMVPVGRENPRGAIGCYWASQHEASTEELELQQALADAMSVGLANLDLYQEMASARQAAEHAEEEVRRLNADLERRVAERTAELTAANRELDSFAYAVSHDLRAPLRAMSGFSQALAEDYGEQLQGEGKIYLEQIDLASRKMGELIDGLLVLSRSTRGELRYDVIDISSLSGRVLAELKQSDPERQVAVQIEEGLQARGDARMIEVVMRNLLGNAWKYSTHAAAPHIRVYAENNNGVRRFCVADNGAGFDMSHANRLFKPFQRLHRQEEFPGIGIGLATVQRIVHRHGGIIEAHGEPGEGAVFHFTLPDMPATPARNEQEI